jgi:hypothetical protein
MPDTYHTGGIRRGPPPQVLRSPGQPLRNGLIVYTLASRNEGETFQSLTINGKSLVTYVITDQDDPDPAKTRSRYEAAGF